MQTNVYGQTIGQTTTAAAAAATTGKGSESAESAPNMTLGHAETGSESAPNMTLGHAGTPAILARYGATSTLRTVVVASVIVAMAVMAASCDDDAPDNGSPIQLQRDSLAPAAIETASLYFSDYDAPQSYVDTFATQGFRAYRRPGLPPWPAAVPLDWNANPFDDSDWRYQLNAWRIFEPFLIVYEETRNAELLQTPLSFIRDWYEFNIVFNKKNDLKWYDASTGIRALRLAYFLFIIARDDIAVDDEDWSLLVELAHLHTHRLHDPASIVTTNHGFWQIHGYLGLCRVAPALPACGDFASYGEEQMIHLIKHQFGNEGMHLEHSPGYHFFIHKIARQFLDSGWYGESAELFQIEQQIEENRTWLVYPNGRLIDIGDSARSELRIAAPAFAPQTCEQARGFQPMCFASREFLEAGYATVRSLPPVPANEGSLVFMTAAYHASAHRHSDDLSFVWYDRGHHLLSDTGRYAYGYSDERRYSISTHAHNTVEVDETSTARDRANAYGSGITGVHEQPWGYWLEGQVEHASLSMEHQRVLLYRPRDWLIVVDKLVSETQRDYTSWFHFDETASPAMVDDAVVVQAGPNDSLIHKYATTLAECEHRMVRGQTEPRIQGWTAVDFTTLIPRSAYGVTCRGDRGYMVHAFLLREDDTSPGDLSPGDLSPGDLSPGDLSPGDVSPRVNIDLDASRAVLHLQTDTSDWQLRIEFDHLAPLSTTVEERPLQSSF